MDALDVITQAYAAVSRRDMATLVELFAEDCEFIDITEPEPSVGRKAFETYMAATFDALPDFRPENPRFIVSGNQVAAELDMVATHRGEFLGVAGTGATVRWPAAAFYTVDVEAGQIVREVYYYDVESLRASLYSPGAGR